MITQFNCQKLFLFRAIQLSQTVLIQTFQFSISIVFVHIQLNVKIVPFQIIQFQCQKQLFQVILFSISMQFSSIWPIDRRSLSGATSGPQWTWEWWHWRSILHSPKLRHYWNLTIRLFSVICRTLVGGEGLTPLQRTNRCILQSQPTGQGISVNILHV